MVHLFNIALSIFLLGSRSASAFLLSSPRSRSAFLHAPSSRGRGPDEQLYYGCVARYDSSADSGWLCFMGCYRPSINGHDVEVVSQEPCDDANELLVDPRADKDLISDPPPPGLVSYPSMTAWVLANEQSVCECRSNGSSETATAEGAPAPSYASSDGEVASWQGDERPPPAKPRLDESASSRPAGGETRARGPAEAYVYVPHAESEEWLPTYRQHVKDALTKYDWADFDANKGEAGEFVFEREILVEGVQGRELKEDKWRLGQAWDLVKLGQHNDGNMFSLLDPKQIYGQDRFPVPEDYRDAAFVMPYEVKSFSRSAVGFIRPATVQPRPLEPTRSLPGFQQTHHGVVLVKAFGYPLSVPITVTVTVAASDSDVLSMLSANHGNATSAEDGGKTSWKIRIAVSVRPPMLNVWGVGRLLKKHIPPSVLEELRHVDSPFHGMMEEVAVMLQREFFQ